MFLNLVRPRDYQRSCAEQFRTLESLRYHLTRRRVNGLVEAGAVVETPLGLRIDPERFQQWMLGKPPGQGKAA